MNILMVTPYFYPKRGGLENYAYNIAKNLVDRGCDVTVLCGDHNNTNNKNKKENIEMINDIKIVRLCPNFVVSNTPVRINLLSEMIKLNKNNFDLINAHTPVPYFADIASIVSRICNKPFILTYHNDIVKDTRLMNIIAQIYNFTLNPTTLSIAKKIITPSPFCYNESQFLRMFRHKVVWIPPGVNIEKYSTKKSTKLHDDYNLPHYSRIVLFVGAMNKGHTHKGVDYLIKAFKRVLEKLKDVYLVLVGEGDMVPEYKKLCNELGISANVIFTGFVDDFTLIEYYRSSDVVVLPSTTVQEGFGMVLIEAGACGKPVIGTKVGGIKYVIKDGETGLLVPPRDPETLASAIVKILEDDELSRRLGVNSRRLVEENYTWDVSVKKTLKVYEELIA